MRAFTLLLFVFTIVAGCLAYYGMGALTETLKLVYAYLLLSTIASGVINLGMRPATPRRMPARVQDTNSLVR